MSDPDEYALAWAETQGLTQEELLELENEEFLFSLDLSEATYRMPNDLLEENVEHFDKIMVDFPPWEVFRDLFSTFERKIDMTHLIEKGYWQGPDEVTSVRGSFMGDGLSFMHLTSLLAGLVRATSITTKVPRPMGQSVGDDLLLLKVKLKQALLFCKTAEGLCCEFSKINSISRDSGTFCEQYLAEVSDLDTIKDLAPFKDSIFGNLVFLDVIKGSILSGHSKVRADGAHPFFGHATMLNKQVKYAPQHTVKERARTFLWVKNFTQSAKLSSAMATLPIVLGGVDMSIGRIVNYSDDNFRKNYLPWYESILNLNERDFLRYYLLLRGIYYAAPKGFVWLNDKLIIDKVVSKCELIKADNIDQLLPDYLHSKTVREKLSHIKKELKLISFHELAALLARQDAFQRLWEGESTPTFMTLMGRNARHRANKAWAMIKSDLAPTAPENFQSRTMNHLKTLFESRTWGLYVKQDDKAVIDCFSGMPTLFLE